MGAVKAARAYTGRPKIAKVEGAYHGQYDFAEVSQTANPTNWGSADHPASVPVASGTPTSVLAEVVVIPFDDPEHAVAILAGNQVGAMKESAIVRDARRVSFMTADGCQQRRHALEVESLLARIARQLLLVVGGRSEKGIDTGPVADLAGQ